MRKILAGWDGTPQEEKYKVTEQQVQAKPFSFFNEIPLLHIVKAPVFNHFCRVQIDDRPNRGIPM